MGNDDQKANLEDPGLSVVEASRHKASGYIIYTEHIVI